MEFNGGGGIVGLNPGGGFVPTNLVPQNQANLDYVNAQNQASLNANNLYGPGGFGYQTDQYAAAAAAYGRATGGFTAPSSEPSYGNYGGDQGPPADRSTLDDAQQQYYDAHESRYGYAPPASFFSGSGPQSWNTMYGGGGVTGGGSASAGATTTAPPPSGSGIGPGSSGQVTGGGSNYADRDSLTDAQQQYYDGHVARYGYPPPASFFTGSGPLSWATMYGGGGGAPGTPPGSGGVGTSAPAQPFSPSGPTASQTSYADRGSLTDVQQQYYDAHVARYGYPPPASFFTGSGPQSWATMYGGAGGSGAPMEEAPPSSPGGLIPGGGGGGGAGNDPAFGTVGGSGGGFDPGYSGLSDAQQQYYQAHIARYGSAPPMSFFTGTGPLSWNSMYGGGGEPAPSQSATGNAGQSPGMAPGMGGFNNQPGDAVRSELTPVQQGYYDAHVARYGYAPPASFFTSNGPLSWNVMYGGGAQTPLGGIGDGTAIQPPVPTSGPGSGTEAIDKAAGIDPNTGEQYPPGIDRTTGQPFVVPPPTPGEVLPFSGNPVNPQQPDFYRSPEQSYKTFQAQNPMVWQKAIPSNDPNIMNAIYAAAGNTGMNPAALAALFDQESSFDPKSHTLDNYGVPQMSANQWRDAPFNGTIGGLTWDQYQNQATPAQQIAAYADWMVRSGNLTKGTMSGVGDQSPEMQAAILQAINLAPNSIPWRTGLVGGNMSLQTGPPQGGNFNDTSIGAMEDVFRQKMSPWSN